MTSKYLFTRKKVINTKSKARFSDFAGIASENLSCVKPENPGKKKVKYWNWFYALLGTRF